MIALGSKSIITLREHYDRQHNDRQVARGTWEDHGLVFTSQYGGPIHPRNLLRNFKHMLRDAGLPEIRFHDLRHTAAALLERSQGGQQLNTAFIERLNATFCSRLATLGRRTRSLARLDETLQAGMYLVGSVYNSCTEPVEVSAPITRACDCRDDRRTAQVAAAHTGDGCWH